MDVQAAGVARVGANDDAFTEFRQDLPAGTAGAERGAGRDDRDCLELAMPFADGFPDRDTLGAIGQSIARVLDINSRVHLAALREKRGADAEFRVRSMRVSLDG